MQSKAGKLARKLKDAALASALVEAGFDNPARLRSATVADLKQVRGIGAAKAKALKARFKDRG